MKIIQTKDKAHLTDVITLYIETFSKGISQQDIDLTHLTKHIALFISHGYTLLAIEENKVIGVLLAYNLNYDQYFPKEDFPHIDYGNSEYIGEVMVKEDFRGQGIGKELIKTCLNLMQMYQTTDVYIRVWDQNVEALSLYKKMGFVPFTNIEQQKTKDNGNEVFTMTKIYLHKKLN
jgi:ribosomal protein S18 acetylase RimI-like enzyme